ncbi:MAG: molybdopterin molybdotransferase MoeA [Anaerolineae bacterium]|nr:molybdopterin molybdotransferase MoeA [Anaerolineae bacterium]
MTLLSVPDALDTILADLAPLPAERVPLLDTLGRVLAEDIHSAQAIPPFTNSAMDGFAVRAADAQGATASQPARLTVVGQVAAGDAPGARVAPGTAVRIMTGAPLPDGADTVVRFEQTQTDAEGVLILAAPTRGDNVRLAGEDIQAGAVAVVAGTVIRPHVIGLLASLGCARVLCHSRPRVAVLATGDELVGLDEPLGPGKIRNSNEYTLAALVQEAGGVPVCLGIARDQADHLRAKLREGLAQGVDLMLTSAGVSVGDYDMVKEVLASEGEMRFWQVAIKPGKPLAFGHVQGVPLIGLPGNPVATAVAFEAFARPALFKLLGRQGATRITVPAILLEELENSGRRHFMRAWVRRQGDHFEVTTRGYGVTVQGSGILSSLVWANCLLIVPEDVTRLAEGALVDVQLLTDTLG